MIQSKKFIADLDVTKCPAPVSNWLEDNLSHCDNLGQIARGVWDVVNRMLKKGASEYSYQVGPNSFFVFKNGVQVVKVKGVSND